MIRILARSAVLFLALPFLVGASSCQQDKEATEKIVEDYIRSHPEVVMETLQKYQEEQRKAQEEAAFKASLTDRAEVAIGDAPTYGPENASITLIEFSDFQCPYCARSYQTIEQLAAKHKGDIRLVFKHNPLPFHKQARPAHKAAIAAARQGKFWAYRDILMTRQSEWSAGDTDTLLHKYAVETGLDIDQFTKDLADPKLDAIIDADLQEGSKIGVQGTPTYLLNGVFVRGARDIGYFEKVVDATKE